MSIKFGRFNGGYGMYGQSNKQQMWKKLDDGLKMAQAKNTDPPPEQEGRISGSPGPGKGNVKK